MNPNFRIIDERNLPKENLSPIPPVPFFMQRKHSDEIYMVSIRSHDDSKDYYVVTYLSNGKTLMNNFTDEDIIYYLGVDTLLNAELVVGNPNNDIQYIGLTD
jgi:hypothetical protein